MIEFGEPIHIYGLVCFLIFIAFLLGLVWGDVSAEVKKAQKNRPN